MKQQYQMSSYIDMLLTQPGYCRNSFIYELL